ncbi:KIR protein, partial [Plasmodium coatneyi]
MTTPLDEGKLPSKEEFYDKFEKADENECTFLSGQTVSLGTQLESTLRSNYPDTIGSKDQILHAYCYARNDKTGGSSEIQRCTFFYYWLGDLFFKNQSNEKLKEFVEKIFSALQETSYEGNCKVNYEGVDKLLFDLMKKLYDFHYDSGTIEGQVQSCKTICHQTYTQYLKKVDAAYNALGALCTLYPDKYCKGFWNENNTLIQMKLSTLQSTLTSKPKATEEEHESCSSVNAELLNSQTSKLLQEKDKAVRNATITSSITSIFGTLGMTVAPFLLYKYKPWSSWFGNHTSGGGRRARNKRFTRNEFDVLTEDTSTYDSATEGSTIGDLSGGNSTVRSSTYNTRQSRGRINNGPSHRNNVGYSRMKEGTNINNSTEFIQ